MRDDPKLSVVLSLREDYVAALEPYVPLLTDRMRARFHMERMGRKAALAAVSRPAEKRGRPFAPDAAEILVDNLSLVRAARSGEVRSGQYIEPVQLRVVCFQLWRNLPPRRVLAQPDLHNEMTMLWLIFMNVPWPEPCGRPGSLNWICETGFSIS